MNIMKITCTRFIHMDFAYVDIDMVNL